MKNKNKMKSEGGEQKAASMAAVADAPLQTSEGSTESRPTRSSGEFKLLPHGKIRPDPNQPRKEFRDEDLHDMAVTIYLQGIIQPLTVKRVPAALKIIEPDMVNGKMWQAVQIADGAVVFESKDEESVRRHAGEKTEEFYQLIAGERRWRSSVARTLEVDGQKVEWPGLKELPVMVREVDERDTWALQNIENQKRVNLSALEEAESFRQELERRRATDPALTVEKLGAELGMKKVTAYKRMKLLRLQPPVRAAWLAGKIMTEHALAIAAVPDVKRQEELLVRCEEDADYNEDMLSLRALEELIDDEYVKQLKDAPFDQAEESLVPTRWRVAGDRTELVLECRKAPRFVAPATIGTPRVENGTLNNPGCFVTTADKFELAGPLTKKEAKNLVAFITENAKAKAITVSQASGWACVTCPHRSGVMDPETKTPKVCTLPSCFDAKVKAHWLRKSEELKAKGTPVLTEGEMRKKGKHIRADKHEYTQNKSGTFKELMGKHAPEPVLVATKEGIQKFYPAEEAIAAAKKNGVKFYTQSGSTRSAADIEKEKAEAEKREQAKARREELVTGLWERIAKAIGVLKDGEAWAFLNEHMVRKPYCDPTPRRLLIEEAKGNRAQVMGKLFMEQCEDLVDYNGSWDEDGLKACKQLGIDLVALDKEAEKAAQPKLPIAKPAPQQKTLIEVKQKGKKTKK